MDETAFNKGCRCGQGNKSKDDDLMQESCRDGSRKSRCQCVARGIGCTNLCRCINGTNIMQARVAQVTPMKQRKRKRIGFSLQKEKRKGVYGRPKSIYQFRDLEKTRNILFDSMPRGAVIP